jgi:hypothetical protein
MDANEPVHLKVGVGSPKLVALCRRLTKDVREVEEAINDLDWLFSQSHPYVRPLLHRGFRARMGIGLKEWERLMDLNLEASQEMEKACFGSSDYLLYERVQVFVEIYEPTVNALNMLFANLGGIAEDARELSSDEGEIRSIETRVEAQTGAVGNMLTTMGAVRSIIEDGSWSDPKV